jgi:gliding motility-associated-like protein
VANAIASGTYSANGFADALETATESGNYSGTYNYDFAINKLFNACADTDSDGIPDLVDIDDDNDGILDATESPTCFYNADELSAPISISTELLSNSTHIISRAIDKNATTSASFTVNQNWIGKEVLKVSALYAVTISSLDIDVPSGWSFSNTVTTNTFKLQGSTDNFIWTDLSSTMTSSLSAATLRIANTLAPNNKFKFYRIVGVGGVSYYAGASEIRLNITSTYIQSQFTKPTCLTGRDDADLIPNYLDLDSDGDGCSDALEAGTTTSTTANFVFTGSPSDFGANGFHNSLEKTNAESNLYKGVYTYYYADNALYNACTDSDGDGISDLIDIDDDNDGILDAVESPTCFYNTVELSQPITVSTELLPHSTNLIGRAIDANAATFSSFDPSQNWVGMELFKVEALFPIPVSSLDLDLVSWALSSVAGNTFKLQGSGDNFAWTDLSTAQYSTATSGTYSLQNTIAPTNKYKYYRIIGVAGVSNYGGVTEIRFNIANSFVQSQYAKTTCLTGRSDGDLIPNYLDLDSDGDGCSDALETGTTTSTTTNFAFTGSNFGANGFLNSLETTTESGVYTGTYYYDYATNSAISTCKDSDGDGVLDFIDLDNDNDGILDLVESPTCFYSYAELANPALVSSELTQHTASYVIGNSIDGFGTTASAFANGQDWIGKEIFKFTAKNYILISGISFDLVNWALSSAAASTFKLQGSGDNANWKDLSAATFSTATTGTFTISNTLATTTKFKYYRLIGVAGTSSYGGVYEARFNLSSSANASPNPKNSCTNDTDGDGKLNHLDLDSDGDGCPDAVEAGTAPIGTTAFGSVSFFNPGTTGSNGFMNSLETATESGIYSGTYKYVRAISSAISACLDTDGDGVSNIDDIDDDNDGITDLKELNCTIANSTDGTCTDALKAAGTYGIFTHCSGWDAFDFDPSPSILDRADFDYMGVSGTDPYFDLQGSYAGPNITGKMVKSFATTTGLSYTFEVELISVFKDDPTTGSKPYLRAIDASTGIILGTTYLNGSGTRTVSFTGIGSATLITLGYDIRLGNIGSLFWKGGKMTQNGEAYQICSLQDTDNDGVPNQLDLDSDGDGCADAVEAGTTYISTSGVASSAKLTTSVIPAPYGANGFANGLETVSESGAYTGTYTYNYAIDATISGCKDTDGDGISDINDLDDDNDGILDIIEDNCSTTVVNKTGLIITKPSTINFTFNGSTIANLIDGVDNNVYMTSAPTGTLNNSSWFNFQFPTPKILTYLEIGHYVGQTLFSTTSTYRIQGSNNNSTWTDVTGTLTYNNVATSTSGGLSTNNSNIANFLNNKTAYTYYRIYGIAATTGGGWATEIYFKETNCLTDIDGDGIPNKLDLDSDGDGCADAIEASSSKTSKSITAYPTGTDNNGNGLLNVYESASAGVISYTSTYSNYALDNTLNYCTDTDNDGVPNLIDLDDDNDGVLDTNECILVLSQTFPTTGENTNTLTGWTVGGTYAGSGSWTSATGRINLNTNGLEFRRDASTTSSITRTITNLPANSEITLGNMYWFNTNAADNSVVATLNVKLNGVTYATIKTGTANTAQPSITVANGATTNLSSLPSTAANTTSSKSNVIIKLPNPIISSASLIIEFIASSSAGEVDDIGFASIAINSCNADTDGDGIANQLDLDSDGDGCSDAVEASSSNTATSISAFPTGTDTNGNGLLNVYESASAGVVSYTSTYATNALDNTKNRCTLNNNYTITSPAALCATNSSPGVLFSSSNVVLQSGTSGSTSIKWQRSTDGGANWADIVGGANATDAGVTYTNFSSNTSTVPYLTFSAAPLSINAYRYRIVSTNVIGYSAYSNAVAITINTIPTITTQPANSVKCTTAATSFSTVANGGTTSLTYQWQVNTNTSSPTWTNITAGNLPNHTGIIYSGYTSATLNLSAAPATANNYQYRVIVTNSCGSATSSSTTLNPTPIAPNITAGGALAICEGSSVTLSTTQVANVSYQWYKNSVLIGGATTTSLVVAQSGVYSLTAKLAGGCTIENSNSAAATTVVVNPIPTASISQGAVLTLTSGASIVLTVSTNAITPTYIWYTAAIGSTTWSVVAGQTTNNLTVSAAGQYKASVVSSTGCSVLSDITTVSVLPAPSITGSTIFCAPGSVLISINKETGQTATWEQSTIGGSSWTTLVADASSTTSSTYTATTTGSYRVVLLGGSAGTADGTSREINVTVNPLPTPIITASATSICAGESISLTGSGGPSYQWLLDGAAISGATSANYTPTLSGAYALKVIDANTCQATSTASSITINPLPATPNISATTANFCYPGSVNLTSYQPSATAGITYEWHTVSSNPTISTLVGTYTQVTTEGTYYLYAKSSTGCYSLASLGLVVTNTTLVQAITTASNQIYNLNATANDLTAGLTNPSYELRWYDALTSGSLLSAPVTPITTTAGVTNYYVEQYDPLGTGCMSSPRQLVTVTVKPLAPGISPNARIVGQTINYCYGASTSTLTASGTNLKWYTSSVGGIANTTAPTVLTGTATTTSHFVSQTVNGVESDRSEIITIVNAALAGTSSITGSTTVVSGMRSSYSITPVADAVSYTWTLPTGWVGSPILNVNDVIIGSSAGNITVKYTDANGCVSPITSLTVELDSDGDGIFDSADLDDDNDGILDTIENAACSTPSASCDTDGDGLPNNLDLDSDGDGITDARESNGIDLDGNGRVDGAVDANGVPTTSNGGVTPADTDGDGKKNPYDTDSDADGIPDSVEKGTNANSPVDTDGDGAPDYLDTDSDNDGIPDTVEKGTNGATPVDTDSDGTPDYLDTDSDNDGIPDSVEKGTNGATPVDTDSDGTPDYLDTDSDNDGIPDSVEKGTDGATPVDTDSDGTPDYRDTDSDNDGIPDTVEKGTNGATPVDTDSDGTPDYLDTDSDNDGIPDSVEKGTNRATPVDTDSDGTPDYLDTDSDNDGIPDSVEKGTNGATPVDTDGDGIPDYRDTDSDNDGIPDTVEKGTNGAAPVDTDGDGTPDYLDTDSDNDGIPDSVEKGTNGATPVDTDGDGIPDYRDTDSDNDGIPDSVEKGTNGATPVDTDGDGIPDYRDMDSDKDGILDAVDNCRTEQGVTSNNGCPVVGTLTLLNDAQTAYVNIPTSGNISTNDVVPAGTTYGQPAQITGATITVNANGTYSFTATVAGTYTYTVPVCAPGQTTNCPTEILVITVPVNTLTNDAQTAYVNIPTSGNISTNDVVPAGTTYGQPAQITGATITVNANGTYSFTATVAGTYTYTVPVCAPGQTTNCPTEILVITVPVNTLTNDAQTAYVNIPTSGNISTNDVVPAGTTYGQPAQITGATITVNANGTYSFTATVAGTYTYTVPVCAPGQTTNCPTEILVITVPVNTLTNDAQTAYVNIPTSGNISTNDVVPAGTTYGQPAQITGATITVNANGTYSFTATVAGTYTYTVPVCAPGQTTNCPTEILVITVPVNTLTNDAQTAYVNIPTSGNISTNDVVPAGTTYGQPAQITGATITVNANGTYSFTATVAGTYTYTVPVCAPGQTTNCPTEILVITVPVNTLTNDAQTAYVNIPTSGNISTNDVVPAGTTYGQPAQITGATITVNANGTYSFTATVAGTYTYTVPVCAPGQTTNCPTEILVITVPVNTLTNDAQTAYVNIPTSGNISTNDVVPAGTTYGQPAQITGATITVNANGTYSFTATVAGTYTYTVPVCAPGQTTNCPTEILVITVPVNTLTNDAQTAYVNIPTSGNISTNDVVPAGTTYGQPAQITGATITVNANGTYSFTATVAGTYTYTVPVCAPGQTINCPTTTIVFTVPINRLVDDLRSAIVKVPISGSVATNDVVPTGTTYGQPAQLMGATITVGSNGTFTFTATVAGTYTYTIPVCAPGQTTNCPTEILVIVATDPTPPPVTKVLDVTKVAGSAILNLDGTFDLTFTIKAYNLTKKFIDSVLLKDDLTKVFNNTNGIKVVSVISSGGLIRNSNYDGIVNTDLVTIASSLDSSKVDSVLLRINVPSTISGNFQNTVIGLVPTANGILTTLSTDPTRIVSTNDTVRKPTLFVIPKIPLNIPEGFSPNNDGIDDTWVIRRPMGTKVSVWVINRWGNEVYKNMNYNNDWRGKSIGNILGEDLPEGTYYYIVHGTDVDGKLQKLAGSLTIKR